LCDWNVCITNVPVTLLASAEAWVLLRSRWQIEVFHPDYPSSARLYLRWRAA